MSVVLTTLIVFSLLFIAGSSTVFACSCVPPGSPNEELEKYTAVFSGQVLSINRAGYAYKSSYKVNFAVEKAWKGVSEKNVVVSTATEGSICGFNFKEGERYIVYANGENSLSTSICSRTRSLATAQDDLSVLGEGKAPFLQPNVPETPPERQSDFSQNLMLIVSWVIIILGIVIYRVFL